MLVSAMRPWTWPRWIAHRGGGSSAPENTLGAVRLAAERGFGAVEIDVRLAADGVPVVIHDATLLRTTGQHGAVHERDAATLGLMRASVGFAGTAFVNETIPALGEVLVVAAHAGLCVNVELKPGPEGPQALAQAVVQTLEALTWAQPDERVLVSSFDQAALAAIAALRPAAQRALLVEQITDDALDAAAALGCVSINIGDGACSAEALAAAQACGLHACVWTVNAPERAAWLFRLGVAAIFTDRLDFLDQPGKGLFLAQS